MHHSMPDWMSHHLQGNAGAPSLPSAMGGGDNSATSPDPTDPAESASDSLAGYLRAAGFVGSALIKRKNTVLLRRGFGSADIARAVSNGVNTRFRIGSVTKTFTAQAVLQLRRQGLIHGLDDSVGRYLPDYPQGQPTLRQLLTHTSGIPEYLSLVDDSQPLTPSELVASFAHLPLRFVPGNGFEYSNSNYALLGLLIETLSGMDYMAYLRATVLQPLGMFHTKYGASEIRGKLYARGYADHASGQLAAYTDMSVPYAAGALVSDLTDLECWATALLNSTWLTPDEAAEVFPDPGTADRVYGLGWFVQVVKGRLIYQHSGAIKGFSSLVALVPESDGMVILLSNDECVQPLLYRILETTLAEFFMGDSVHAPGGRKPC